MSTTPHRDHFSQCGQRQRPPSRDTSTTCRGTESALDVKDPARRPLLAVRTLSTTPMPSLFLVPYSTLPSRNDSPPPPEPCSSSPTPHYLPGMPVPPPGALPLSRGAHSGAAGQRPTSTTTAPRPRARSPYSTMPSRDVSPPPRSPAPFPWCPLRRRGPAQNVNDYRAAERRDHSVSALAG